MPKRPRSSKAALRASFGRAERLRREAGDTRQPRPEATRKSSTPGHADRAGKQEARGDFTRAVDRDRRQTPLHRVEERLERSRTAAERRQQIRLKEQIRTAFNEGADRRRDTERRAEHDRKREALQQKTRRIEEHQRRAAAEIERDLKRRTEDQKAEHRRQQDQVRARHKGERNSYRVNENTVMERHYHAIKGIDRREADRLHDFDGRRNGLAGRAAELIPGRRAENDRQRAEIVRGYEAERVAKHRELEAFKERSFAREQKTRLDQARELKDLRAMHRDERATFSRDQADLRPRQIEDRARAMDRAERVHERERERGQDREERPRETARPSGDFARAALNPSRDPAPASREASRDEGREMVRPTPAFGRA